MPTRTVLINLVTRTSGATRGVTKLQGNLRTLNKGAVQTKSSLGGMTKQVGSAKRGLSGLAGGMGSAGLAAGAMGAGILIVGKTIQASVSAFGNFEDKMNSSLAIMGDVSDAMKNDMTKAAREMGKTTRFSAEEAAESYFFLASAGLDAKQSIAALPAVAAFGQAGMFDMALATDLLTDAQSALGLTVDDSAENLSNMTRVSDVFVKANTLANTSVQQVSEAITNKLGAALRASNIEIEEGVAVLAAYADQGLKGASAGEAFGIVLRDLKKVNRESADALAENNIAIVDSEGNFRAMADVIFDLEQAFDGLSVAEQAKLANDLGFQDRSFKNIQLLLGQSDAIRGYTAELEKAGGVTEDVAGKQLESFNAQMGLAGAIVHDAAIELGEVLAPTILEAAQGFGKFLAAITPMIPTAIKLLKVFIKYSSLGQVFKAIGIAVSLFQKLRGVFDEDVAAANELRDAASEMNESIEKGADPAQALTSALVRVGKEGVLTADAIAELGEKAGATDDELMLATRSALVYAEANSTSAVEVIALKLALRDQIQALGLTEKETEKLLKKEGVLINVNKEVGRSFNNIDRTVKDLADAEGDLADETDEVTDEMMTLADALAAAEENQQSLADTMLAFTDPTFAAIDAVGKLREANENLIEVQEDTESSAQDIAAAQLEVAKATLEAQGKLDAFSAGNIQEQISVIATALGISKGEASDLLEELGLIDGKTVRTVIEIDRITRESVIRIARRHGGPVREGVAYTVGEAGPELFVPVQAGTIIPNDRLISEGVNGSGSSHHRDFGRGGVTFGDINVRSQADPVALADAITWQMKTRGI